MKTIEEAIRASGVQHCECWGDKANQIKIQLTPQYHIVTFTDEFGIVQDLTFNYSHDFLNSRFLLT